MVPNVARGGIHELCAWVNQEPTTAYLIRLIGIDCPTARRKVFTSLCLEAGQTSVVGARIEESHMQYVLGVIGSVYLAPDASLQARLPQ